MDDDILKRLEQRLERIEMMLTQHQQPQPPREWYSVAEFAKCMDRKECTVREWCLFKRIDASKTECGRGGKPEWRIPASEVQRVKEEGLLLPLHKRPLRR